MAEKFRVGIIASGRIARMHGGGWRGCDRTEIVAIADSHPEALAIYAREFVEGVIENELPTEGGLYQLGATIYGSDGMMEIHDNSLKYMISRKAGW